MSFHRSSLVLALGCTLATTAALQADSDPPSRVARLNYFSGSVSFRPAEADDWSAAEANYPLTTGDHLWADRGSRGEIHLGSTVIRLAPETAFAILNLDDQTAQIRLAAGSVYVRVPDLQQDEVVEIDTPNAAISVLRPGTYRIDVSDDGQETAVTVRHGAAEVTAGGSAVPVRSGDTAYFSGTDSATYDVRESRRTDDWEEWCQERDLREERASSRRYVSPEVVGYEDLDEYGTWREVPEYGAVWTPRRVEVGWAPYHHGHWAWVRPWGWTWVDDAPWGFAPFHYGRWAYYRGGWCWVPGTIVARPAYAPALVVFLGGGSWDGVAWLPLGPREIYVPPYHVSPVYLRHINVPHVTITKLDPTIITVGNANTSYANQRVVGAVTAVPGETFLTAKPVHKAAVTVPARLVGSAPVGTPERFKPRVDSIVGAPVGGPAVPHPPARVSERPVFARITPPPQPPRFSERESPVAAKPHADPLVRPAMPSKGEGPDVKLRPKREGLPAAQPVTTPRSTGGGTPDERAGRHNPEPLPLATPRSGGGDRPGGNDRPDTKREHVVPEPTPRPTARPDLIHDREPRATPPEREVRPTPRPEVETKPTPRPDREVRPTPRPTPTPREKEMDTRPEPRRTPRPEPTEKPHEKATPKPKPTPTPTPSPKDKKS